MRISRSLKIVFIVFAFIAVSFSYYFYQMFFTSNVLNGKDKVYTDTVLYIPTGATFQTVKDSLEKKGFISDKASFYFLAKILKYPENVKAGRYLLKVKSSNIDVINKLKKGEQDQVKLTFTNIRLKRELTAKLGAALEPAAQELDSLMKEPAFVSQFGFDTTTIMTMFIPNTYYFYWNTSAKNIFKRMHTEYKNFWTAERLQKAKDIGLTPVEVSIMASIVQAESQYQPEKARIAGVYLNRIRTGMPLQADPTLVFALGDFTIKRIYFAMKELESPYNTYKHLGLPPGPINLPSIKTLDAVLNAEKHKYYYFCASEALNGTHNYAETLSEHERNAERYRKALDKLNIR
ncbi:MAG: endolytic transglycosylase MltG [Cytophagaceae bacterium]|nr:endolytic transglycosylase MltG [Cytophagaceae bacterium]